LPEASGIYEKTVAAEDFDAAAIITGEGVGIIREVRPAADVLADMVSEEAHILKRAG
jgi:nitronate monooxygenase